MEEKNDQIFNNAAEINDTNTEQINIFDIEEGIDNTANVEENEAAEPSEEYSEYTEADSYGMAPSEDSVTDADEEDEVLEGQLEMDFGNESDIDEQNPEQCPAPSKKKNAYDPENPRKIDTVFDFVELFIFALVAVLVFTTFFFRHSVVEGSSMENTLHDGEHLIISSFFYTPERGDIVVCEDYSTPHKKPIVKRIIGIEGDHIKVTAKGKVTLNGEALDEDYVFIDGIVTGYPVDITVGEGEIFVMGDHRNMSDDSRSFGTVDTDSIIGKVLIRFYPFDKFGSVE